MTTSGLSVRIWNDAGIARRNADGFVNATQIAKANGKHLPHYMANERTKQYVQALSAVVGIPTTDLIKTRQGGTPELQGTWMHPRLAVDLARWISPEFAVWMDEWFLDAAQGYQHAPQCQTVSRSEIQALSDRIDAALYLSNETEALCVKLGRCLDHHGQLDFSDWFNGGRHYITPAARLKPATNYAEPAWPCTPEQHAKAALRLVTAANSRGVTTVTPRDVLTWRIFGRRRLTARQALQFLCEAASSYRLGVMTPGRRRNQQHLHLEACSPTGLSARNLR